MKISKATISSKGQVVLPREVRERLGVEKGDEIEFVLSDKGVQLRPRLETRNPFLAWIGAAPPLDGEDTESLARQTRHVGMSEEDLTALRGGPGARVIRLEACAEPGSVAPERADEAVREEAAAARS